MKDFPITIGFDDAKFNLNSNTKTTDLIGVICQGTRMVGMVKKKIYIDGDDATEALIDLTKQNEKHVQYILSDSITFGGFNIIDLDKVYGITKKPIIAVTERLVNLEAVRKAVVKKFPNKYGQKLQNIVNAGELYETSIETAGGFSKVYFHSKGIQFSEVDSLLRKVCIDSKTPEPVRLAHIVGKAI
jgi:endonuclease V-like protein UPF0215 family